MIQLTDFNGREVYLAPKAIAQVTEAGTSSQWHGIRSIVRTFDGQTLEIQQTAAEVAQRLEKDAQ
jgi:hypothetical protein